MYLQSTAIKALQLRQGDRLKITSNMLFIDNTLD
jgi:hypothetical protein